MKCTIYTRVSTDNQAEIEFNSCEAQEAKIKSFIKSQENMEVFKVYSDAGYTGANINRPALTKMLCDIRESKIDTVISYKIDRLTRSPKDFYQLIDLFDKHGVDFISVTERFDTSTPSGRLLRNIMLTFAQFERELTSERTRDKLFERAQKGLWNGGFVPFGYSVENKKLIIDEKEAEIVKETYESYVDSRFRGNDNVGRKNNNLSKSRIANMLRNPIYTGKIRYANKLYQGIHEPIISEDIFNLAQELHKKKRRTIRLYKNYSLAGLIRCKECDSAMTPCHTNKKKKQKRIRYYYYRCTKTFKTNWNSCNTKQVSANRLEDYIFENLERISSDRHYIDSLVFKLNNSVSSDRKGLELNDESSKISSETLKNNLDIFLKDLPKRKGIEKNIWVRKFIKSIVYSKEEIAITLYYARDFEKETVGWIASGRAAAAAGHSSGFGTDKKIPLIPRYKGNDEEWLLEQDSNLRQIG